MIIIRIVQPPYFGLAESLPQAPPKTPGNMLICCAMLSKALFCVTGCCTVLLPKHADINTSYRAITYSSVLV